MIHVVLFEPEIPQNTGNIMRTCAATNAVLHLIEPMGFSLDEKHLRRSGMDYREICEFHQYKDWDDFAQKHPGTKYFVTRYGKKPPSSFDFSVHLNEPVYLVFGKESTGIPKDILRTSLDTCMRLPMVEHARSLNLSNTVAICVYEVLRQLNYPGLSSLEVIKGADWLENDH